MTAWAHCQHQVAFFLGKTLFFVSQKILNLFLSLLCIGLIFNVKLHKFYQCSGHPHRPKIEENCANF